MPAPRRIAATVDDVLRLDPPCSVADLASAGISRGRVRAAIEAGALMVPRRGIVLPTEVWRAANGDMRHHLALRCALQAYPGSWASHESAARLHGLPTRDRHQDSDTAPEVHVSREMLSLREAGLTIHGHCVPDEHIVHHAGLPCTSLVRTSIEHAATRSLPWAVAILDAAMRRQIALQHGGETLRPALLDPLLRDAADRTWRSALGPYFHHRWVTVVRQALDWAEPAAESVLESLSRVEVRRAGLPVPRCGVPVTGDNGVLYWVDMLWDEQRVIGEADGTAKYSSVADLVAEKRRQEALTGAGYTVVRWGWAEAVTSPGVLAQRLRRALQPPSR